MNILLNTSRNLAIVVAMLFGVSAASVAYAEEPVNKSKMNEKSKPAKKIKSSKGEDVLVEMPILMLVPVNVSNDVMNQGCWVTLYDAKDYQGDSFTITGPINMPTMVGPFGFNWDNKVRSLQTGPKANVTIFNNWNFQSEDKFIDVSTRVPNLSKEMGFFDNFRSMMLSCV